MQTVSCCNSYWLFANWTNEKDALQLTVTDGRSYWQSELLKLKELCIAQMEFALFQNHTFQAFNNIQDESKDMQLCVVEKSEQLEVQWKLEYSEIKILLGSINLLRVSSQFDSITGSLVNESIQCKKKIDALETELSKQKNEIGELNETISDLEGSHFKFKKEVYGKFKDLLNSKKRKIRKLMRLVERRKP